MPNTIAYLSLLIWPLISIFIFKKFSIVVASSLTIVLGYLILPVNTAIDLPAIPPLSKEALSSIAALSGLILIKRVKVHLFTSNKLFSVVLIILVVVLPFLTVITNFDPVYNGQVWVKGLALYDAFSMSINRYLHYLPLIIGFSIIRTHKDHVDLFKVIFLLGLIYIFPALFEIRMSPQLHTWIYGFFPHSFIQQIRYDGFRPVVFLGHGLLVGMFFCISFLSGFIVRGSIKAIPAKISLSAIVGLFITLILSKTLSSLFLAALGLLILILFRKNTKNITTIAFILAATVLAYPILSIFNLFPHQDLIDLFSKLDPARGGSLWFRFYHESILLDHANLKMLFGWGGWGRNRLWDSITDGAWIIIYGQNGFIGFFMVFLIPLLAVYKTINLQSSKYVKADEVYLLAGHSLIIALLLIDQIPNASISPYFWLLIGGLWGRIEHIRSRPHANDM